MSLKFYSRIGILHMPHRTATWIQLGNIFPSTSQSKWPSRMNHPVDGIDPEGYWRICAYTRVYVCVRTYMRTCTLTTFCSHAVLRRPARLRLSSANEFRFSSTVRCHVKLHRRAFLSHSHVYTRRYWRHACRGVEYRIRHVRDEQTPRLPTCLRNCRETSLVCRLRFRLRNRKMQTIFCTNDHILTEKWHISKLPTFQ